MPEYRRDYINGATYFFTVNTYQRQPIFTHPVFRNTLKVVIKEAIRIYPFKIDAWVLLPDHLHCIWTMPENNANFSPDGLLLNVMFPDNVKLNLYKNTD